MTITRELVGPACPQAAPSGVGPFLLYCLPRTGSTTLLEILNMWTGVSCVNEPFSPTCDPQISQNASTEAELVAATERLWATYTGFKHVGNWGGWPFADRDLNEVLLRTAARRAKVVLLTRGNLLRRNVSYLLAMQTKVWHYWTRDQRAAVAQHDYSPLDVTELRRGIERDLEFIRHSREVLAVAGARYLECSYESLFDPATGGTRQSTAFEQIRAFLGLPIDPSIMARAYDLIRSNPTATNSPTLYSRVPGLHEVEAVLGSDATGWLFR